MIRKPQITWVSNELSYVLTKKIDKLISIEIEIFSCNIRSFVKVSAWKLVLMPFVSGKGKNLKLKINVEQYETTSAESESAGLLVKYLIFKC